MLSQHPCDTLKTCLRKFFTLCNLIEQDAPGHQLPILCYALRTEHSYTTITLHTLRHSCSQWGISTPAVVRHAQLPGFDPRLPQCAMNALSVLTRPQAIPCTQHSPRIRHPGSSSSARVVKQAVGEIFCTVNNAPVLIAGHTVVKDAVVEGAGGLAATHAVPEQQQQQQQWWRQLQWWRWKKQVATAMGITAVLRLSGF